MKFAVGILAIVMSISLAHARKPAVLPVTGLSIEELKHPANPGGPEKVGFDFTQGASRDENLSADAEVKALMAAAGAFTVLIPFIYVFFFRVKGQDLPASAVAPQNNVTALPIRNKSENDNIKKAS